MITHPRPRIEVFAAIPDFRKPRLPRDVRQSAMSEKTSMRGRGCAIMNVDLNERVLGQRGGAGQAKPHVDQNPLTYFQLD